MADSVQPFAVGEQHAAPGGRLGEARRTQNLTTADVARQLKLSVWQVEALEAGRYEQLPGPIFVRGFIRNYARLVKLDPQALLSSAGAGLPQAAEKPEAPPSQNIPFPGAEARRWPKYAAAAVIILGALAAYEFLWNEPQIAPLPSVAVQSPPVAAPRIERTVAESPVPVTPAEVPVADAAVSAPQPAQRAATSPAVSAPVLAKAPGERQVKFVFSEECWVEVRDRRDRIIFSQLNRAGTVQEVSGLPPLSVVVGNAHGVRMTYDDQPVDLARHTKIDVARLTLE